MSPQTKSWQKNTRGYVGRALQFGIPTCLLSFCTIMGASKCQPRQTRAHPATTVEHQLFVSATAVLWSGTLQCSAVEPSKRQARTAEEALRQSCSSLPHHFSVQSPPLRHFVTSSLRHFVTSPLRHFATSSLRHFATKTTNASERTNERTQRTKERRNEGTKTTPNEHKNPATDSDHNALFPNYR